MFNFQNINKKKVLLIIGFVAVCIALGFAIYYLFFKPVLTPIPTEEVKQGEIGQLPSALQGEQPGAKEQPKTEEITGQIQETKSIYQIAPEPEQKQPDEIAQGGITKVNTLTYQKVDSLTLNSDGKNPTFYNAETGKFYSVDLNTKQTTPLTDKVYKNVENISWSPNKDKVIMEFPDGTNIAYNFLTQKQTSLPKDWTDFSYNQTGSQIAFKDLNQVADYRFVGVANEDGSGQKYLEYLGDDPSKFIVDWSPNGKMVAQYKSGQDSTTSKVYFVGQYGENFKSITVNGYGLKTQWSPTGDTLLYSARNTYSDHKPLLNIVDASGENIGLNHHNLNLYTWADKCSFANSEELYCAVPKELPYGAGLTPSIADNTPDYIYRINTKTGVKSFVAQPEYDYTIQDITVSKDGDKLYFTDKASGSLHMIKLK